jgi:hypothetical protein
MKRQPTKIAQAFCSADQVPAGDSAWIRANLEPDRLRTCLIIEHTIADAKVQPWVKRATDEAVSLAWATTYPLLVFPVLLEEKLHAATRNLMHRRTQRNRSGTLTE